MVEQALLTLGLRMQVAVEVVKIILAPQHEVVAAQAEEGLEDTTQTVAQALQVLQTLVVAAEVRVMLSTYWAATVVQEL